MLQREMLQLSKIFCDIITDEGSCKLLKVISFEFLSDFKVQLTSSMLDSPASAKVRVHRPVQRSRCNLCHKVFYHYAIVTPCVAML